MFHRDLLNSSATFGDEDICSMKLIVFQSSRSLSRRHSAADCLSFLLYHFSFLNSLFFSDSRAKKEGIRLLVVCPGVWGLAPNLLYITHVCMRAHTHARGGGGFIQNTRFQVSNILKLSEAFFYYNFRCTC
jgi:hypothetical protein